MFILALYTAAALGLFVYGANCYVLLGLFHYRRRERDRRSRTLIMAASDRFDDPASLPAVTTQIPLFNEANVAERVIRAAASIDYPHHEVQVLDDSTDETQEVVDRVAAELNATGHRVTVVRRSNRIGFKAGALAHGLRVARGDYIAIFDADFVPPSHFLRHTLPFFFADPNLGLVQARWGHLNPSDSLLTRAQAIGIDGHFMVEQSARAFNGLLMNFNGTAGIWRRRAIEEAGGWSADTLTEDLDLSYRAQLAGWRTHFLAHLEVPGELPVGIAAFKSQQFRWAKGSIQTAGKLLPRIWASKLSLWVKFQAALHLTHYTIHPLMLVIALLTVPAMLQLSDAIFPELRFALVVGMVVAVVAPNALYLASQQTLYPHWRRHLWWLPALTCIGIGVAVSNSRAVVEAVIGRKSDFVRTPKQGDRSRKTYHVATPILPWIELALGGYCGVSLLFYLQSGRFLIGPFLFVYAVGFLMIGSIGLWEIRWTSPSTLRSAAPLLAR